MERIVHDERGQILPFVALSTAFAVGIVGLAVDVGILLHAKRVTQTAADLAATAGASELNYGGVTAAAQAISSANGVTDGVNHAKVTVNNPPGSGPHIADSGYVEVIASVSVPTYFSQVFRPGPMTVTSRAVASLAPNHACLIALTPTSTGILVNGGNTISMPTCAIYDDSADNSSAMLVNGSSSLTASTIGIVGALLRNGTNQISPVPVTGIAAVSDPLGYLQPPTVPSSCTGSPTVINGSGTYTLNQGCYSSLTINGSATVNFNPGTYIVKGALTFNGSGTVNGTGVTFYTLATTTFNGAQKFNLSAPTSGSFNGVLFFQARTDSNSVTINGANNTVFKGIFYYPAAQATFNGVNSTSLYATVVCWKFIFNGNLTIKDYATINPKTPLRGGTLSE